MSDEMVAADAPWCADLMARRRAMYERYSPVFWKPAIDATVMHLPFLLRQIESNEVVSLRLRESFVIAQVRGAEGFIDDFAVEDPATWHGDGRELLRDAWKVLSAKGCTALRVVSAKADAPKVSMLESCGLDLVDEWWVRPVAATAPVAESGRLEGPGFSGIFGPAPPVYDPGGRVLLVDQWSSPLDPGAVAAFTSRVGGVLSIVATKAGPSVIRQLESAGWTAASSWFAGVPSFAP